MQRAMLFNDSEIVSGKESYYTIYYLYMSKNEAINLLRNADLIDKC